MHIKRLCTVPGTSCRYHSWSLRWAGFLKWKMVFFLNFDTHWRGDTHGSASVRHRLFCVRVLLPALVHTHQWLSLPGSMAGDLVLDSTQQLGAWLTLPPLHTHTHTRTRELAVVDPCFFDTMFRMGEWDALIHPTKACCVC